ncbi:MULTISPECIES: hypothetical protein [unclassified Rathayibacter]|uniref:hypothetical protein n=1 Tax=unclassified Rathayibacter TaxID=2609250 RepID=UPI000CE74833|nr:MULTISPECIES: hypothetical protein [unclassified Rathayibacter]PPF35417.1 hypothetical protein C5B93_11020 [Rathayibacter sp. AY1A2]PPG13429.1 hypothetical protein C5D36_13525 [Rathayibacter sp. AY1C6]PPH94859.1 hypothetical protein C5C82_00965 [Rathayibacter sp. AY1D5]PPI04198.1 hypothetical protein C5C63_16160 [Rathayibacter sp. AY1B8]
MRLRSSAAAALLALALAAGVSGCASGEVIDVPESAGLASTTPVPSAAPTVSSVPSSEGVDCATALPASLVEQEAGLTAGTVSITAAGDTCSYAVDGGDPVVVLTLHRGPLVETFTGAGEALGAVPVSLGTAAYWVQGIASAPSELAVLAGGWEARIVSSVGEQSTLVGWAVSALATVDVPLAVA